MIIRVVDFETTGLEPPAQVCEVGICDIDMETKAIVEVNSWLCGVNEMPPEAQAIHHISKAQCDEHPPFDQSAIFRTPCIAVVSHNAAFEGKFYQSNVPVICTYKAALRVWPEAPSHSNQALRYWLGLELDDRAMPPHRAGPDAYVTANVLIALLKTGTTGKQMAAWTWEPALMPRCPIGDPWCDKPWSEVDGGFLGWIVRKVGMDEDIKWNAQREIDRRQENAK